MLAGHAGAVGPEARRRDFRGGVTRRRSQTSILVTSFRRLAALARACGRHGAAQLLCRRAPRLAARLGVRNLGGPRRLRQVFEDVGGTFVKFGQMLALQPDILPVEYCNALFKLLDQVAPFPYPEVERIVREELGASPDELFERFERTPLATASVGQVHIAWLSTGGHAEKVAIKVQRPNVETEFESDVRLMGVAIKAIRTFRLRFLEFLIEPMEEFISWTQEELDYRYEARYGIRLRENARDNPVQYVPRVYDHLTTRRTLVVEFLDGVTLLEYLRARERGDEVLLARLAARGFDRTRFAANVIDNFLGDCFHHGLYHADLHPANLIILDDNVVGYIDYGITGAMSPYSRRHLVAMTLALAQGDTETLHSEFLSLSALSADADPRALYDSLAALAEVWYQSGELRGEGRRLQVSFTRVCRDMLAVSRQTGVLPERDIIKYIRSAITIDGLCSRFRPEFHVGQRLATVCARQIRRQSTAAAFELHNLVASSTSGARLLVDGPARSLRLLDRLAEGDLPVHAEVVQAAGTPDRRSHERTGTVRLAVVAVALSLILSLGREPVVLGLNLFTAELILVVTALTLLVPRMRRLVASSPSAVRPAARSEGGPHA